MNTLTMTFQTKEGRNYNLRLPKVRTDTKTSGSFTNLRRECFRVLSISLINFNCERFAGITD